jgi:hypothetical protein
MAAVVMGDLTSGKDEQEIAINYLEQEDQRRRFEGSLIKFIKSARMIATS